MTSSSSNGQGGGKPASSYARFIPREELGDFAAWQPGSFNRRAGDGGGNAGAAGGTPVTPEADAEDLKRRLHGARQAGYQEGYRDGMAALENFKQTFAAQATAQIGALVAAFDTQLHALDERIAAAVARTALELARQVLRSELEARPELVAKVAAEAVNAVLLSARHITVQVHPHDLPLVAEGADEVLKARGARLVADAAIARGGVLVDSDLGAVDARIGQRWAQAAQAVGDDTPWEDDSA